MLSCNGVLLCSSSVSHCAVVICTFSATSLFLSHLRLNPVLRKNVRKGRNMAEFFFDIQRRHPHFRKISFGSGFFTVTAFVDGFSVIQHLFHLYLFTVAPETDSVLLYFFGVHISLPQWGCNVSLHQFFGILQNLAQQSG